MKSSTQALISQCLKALNRIITARVQGGVLVIHFLGIIWGVINWWTNRLANLIADGFEECQKARLWTLQKREEAANSEHAIVNSSIKELGSGCRPAANTKDQLIFQVGMVFIFLTINL